MKKLAVLLSIALTTPCYPERIKTGSQITQTTIGVPVFNGTANSVLYLDAYGNLAQDNPGFTYVSGTGLALDDALVVDGATTLGNLTVDNAEVGVNIQLYPQASRARTGQVLIEGGAAPAAGTPLFKVNHLVNDGNRMLVTFNTLGVVKFSVDNEGDVTCGTSISAGTFGFYGGTWPNNAVIAIGANYGANLGTLHATAIDRGKLTIGQDGTVFVQRTLNANKNFNYLTVKRDLDGASAYTVDGYLLKLEDDVTNDTGGTRGYINADDKFIINEDANLTRIDNQVDYWGTANDSSISFVGDSLNIKANAVTATDEMNLIAHAVNIGTSTTNKVKISSAGATVFVGAAGMVFVEISTRNNTVPMTLNSAAKVQVTVFGANGHSLNATPDHTNDHVTIIKPGKYFAAISVHVNNNAAQTHVVNFTIYKNNGVTEFGNVHAHRTLVGGSGDVGSVSLNGIIDLVATDTVEVWADTDSAADRSITIEDITLSLFQIGG